MCWIYGGSSKPEEEITSQMTPFLDFYQIMLMKFKHLRVKYTMSELFQGFKTLRLATYFYQISQKNR